MAGRLIATIHGIGETMTFRAHASRMSGLSFLRRDSGGDLVLASCHPHDSATWHWSVTLIRSKGRAGRAKHRTGQWNDWYWLPFGFRIVVGQQDWHKRLPA